MFTTEESHTIGLLSIRKDMYEKHLNFLKTKAYSFYQLKELRDLHYPRPCVYHESPQPCVCHVLEILSKFSYSLYFCVSLKDLLN